MKALILSDSESRAIKTGARQIRVPCNMPEWVVSASQCGTAGIEYVGFSSGACPSRFFTIAPYAPGDLVPCKEAWRMCQIDGVEGVQYRSDFSGEGLWETSQRMPPWAVRYFLRITESRPEKVSEITEADALLCGASPGERIGDTGFRTTDYHHYRMSWQARYPKHPWADSWCWVIDFKLEERNV